MLLRMYQRNIRRLQVGNINRKPFCRTCPDEHDNLHRIYLAHKEVHCASDLLGLCCAQRPELCSMVACLASDLGLDAVDFDLFDAQVWRVVKKRLKSQLGLTPHIALVAKEATRTQMPPMGVDQLR